MKKTSKKRITTNATTVAVTTTCAVVQIVIAVHNPGTTWSVRIQDAASTPFVLVPQFDLALQNTQAAHGPMIIFFDEPIYMDGGVNIVTAGATPGETFVWITYII